MGLAVLPCIDKIISGRKKVVQYYNNKLDFSELQTMKLREGTTWNHSYYPVLFKSESMLLRVQQQLNAEQIFPRRYFFPSINTIDHVKAEKMPIAESIAARILCLPLYTELGEEEEIISNICNIINSNIC